MAESTKVRLVRCPKCENLLPELADYSVYQCGGCGAVLRAKNKNQEVDALADKSHEGVSEATTELQNSVEKGLVQVNNDAYDVDVKSNTSLLRFDDETLDKNDIGSADESKNQSKASSGKGVVEMNVNKDDLVNLVGRECADLNSQAGNTGGSWRSGRMSSWQHEERGQMEGLGRVTRTEVEDVRFSTSNYPDEGPSNCNLDSSYSYGEPLRIHDAGDGANRVQSLEKDRAELLKKLDELKEQLIRSCNVADKPEENNPVDGRLASPDPYVDSDTCLPGTSSMTDRASAQYLASLKHAAGTSYFNHRTEQLPYNNGHDMAVHGFHPSMHKSSPNPGYREPFGPQILKGASHQFPSQFQQPPRQYFSGHYFDTSSDPFEPYQFNAAFHQPSCSCLRCYDKHHGVSAPVPPTAFYNKRFPDVSQNPMLYYHDVPGGLMPHSTNSRPAVPPPLRFHASNSHTRWPSDLHSEMGNFVRCCPQKVVLASNGRCCHPVAGGAPFLTCFNCFELLQLPKKVLLMAKNQQKMRCGACSTLISFSVVNNKLVPSVNTESARIPTEVDDSSHELMKSNASYSYRQMNQISTNFSSDDYDDSGYDFQEIDMDPTVLSTDQAFNSTNPQEMQRFHSSSPSTSEEENTPEVLVAPKEVISSIQQPIKAALSPPPAGSPLQEHFDYSSNNHVVNRFGKGNRSSRSDQEKVITNKAATRQNSMKEASLATEMDVTFNEYSNNGVFQDSGDTNREDSHSKTNKGGQSFFTNIIKKSFKDFSKSNQTNECSRNNVYVNGRLIPDRLVKKAERLAGPIHPGQYWYDFRAGFWGVMDGPCLGIIPPFIEEFNHSMPQHCAGGTTSVFINGRELHQKDLDLLARRGLPTDRDRSYIVEISGRVLDEDSGEELDSLGKLAPTVERARHGFGMKAPNPDA